MRIKIKLQTGKPEDFELDLYEAYCSPPIIMEDRIVLGGYIARVDVLDETFNKLPEEIKNVLNEKKIKYFYLKRLLLTITELTAYQVCIGDPGEKKVCAEKIFNNFDESIDTFLISSNCNFPYKNIEIYFQTKGDIFLEFDIEDAYFVNATSSKELIEIQMKESKKIEEINKEKPSNFLENIHNRKFRK